MRLTTIAICALLVVPAAVVSPARATAATLQETWAVGPEPFGVTVDPRDGKVYVAISDSQNSSYPEPMYVVDPAAGPYASPALIPLPTPQVMSVLDTALDRLFVPLTDGTLAFVDVGSGNVAQTVPNAGLLGLALDATTHRVYSALGYSGLVAVDGVSGAVVATASPQSGDSYWGVAHDPLRHRVYATNLDPAQPGIVVLDDADLHEIGRVSLPEVPRFALAVDAARDLVYVGGLSTPYSFPGGHLYAVDGGSLSVVSTLDVGQGSRAPFWVTLDPSGRLYVSDIDGYAGGDLTIVDGDTFSVVERTELPWEPGASALHPDGRLYVTGFNAGLLAALDVHVDRAPVVDAVRLTPDDPRTSDVLHVAVQAHDPDGDPVTLAYRWYRNGVLLGETGDALDLAQAGNGDRGDVVTVEVVPSDGARSGDPVSASVTVENSVPLVTVALGDGSPRKRDLLVATASASDADGEALTYTYTWTVGSKVRLTERTTSPTSALDLKAAEAEVGDVVTVVVNVSDGTASVTADASATVTPAGR